MDNVEITTGNLDKNTLWDERNLWLEMQAKSMKEWEDMTTPQREKMIALTRKQMKEMTDSVEEWLPACMIVEEKNQSYIDIKFRLMSASEAAIDAYLAE